MPSIVQELQQLATDGDASVTVLLRKALLVASKLDLTDFQTWIKSELDGYRPIAQPGDSPAGLIAKLSELAKSVPALKAETSKEERPLLSSIASLINRLAPLTNDQA